MIRQLLLVISVGAVVCSAAPQGVESRFWGRSTAGCTTMQSPSRFAYMYTPRCPTTTTTAKPTTTTTVAPAAGSGAAAGGAAAPAAGTDPAAGSGAAAYRAPKARVDSVVRVPTAGHGGKQ